MAEAAPIVGLVAFSLSVIQGALQKANAVRLACEAHADIERRYWVLVKRTEQLSAELKEVRISATRAPAGTLAGTGDELGIPKELVCENIAEGARILKELASKIPHEGDEAVNDGGGEAVADGARKRKRTDGASRRTK